MAMAYFFKKIFSLNGLRKTTPATSEDGLDLNEGYSLAYQQPRGIEDVERDYFNGLLYEITYVLNEFQTLGAIRWTPPAENDNAAVVYNKGDLVHHLPPQGLNGLYVSRENNNTDAPVLPNMPSPKWTRIDNVSGLAVAFRPKNNLTGSVPEFQRVDVANPTGICGVVKHGSNTRGIWRQFSDNTIYFELRGSHTAGTNPQTYTLPININTTTHDVFWDCLGITKTANVPLDVMFTARLQTFTSNSVTILFDYTSYNIGSDEGYIDGRNTLLDFTTTFILPCTLVSKTGTTTVQQITFPTAQATSEQSPYEYNDPIWR